MYQHLSGDDFRSHYKLGADYRVDGILAVGVWSYFGHLNLEHIHAILKDANRSYSCRRLEHHDLYEVYEFVIDGRVIWYFSAMGTAVTHMYLHRGSMLGSKKNILVGSVGGLSPDVSLGDMILSTQSYGNDNARYYQRDNNDNFYTPDLYLVNSLESRLSDKTRVHRGATMTCEMISAETDSDIHNWSKAGYLGVEMEAALVFALSGHFNIPAAAILNIGDNLIKGQTFFDPSFAVDDSVRESSRKIALSVALDELLSSS